MKERKEHFLKTLGLVPFHKKENYILKIFLMVLVITDEILILWLVVFWDDTNIPLFTFQINKL